MYSWALHIREKLLKRMMILKKELIILREMKMNKEIKIKVNLMNRWSNNLTLVVETWRMPRTRKNHVKKFMKRSLRRVKHTAMLVKK